VQDLRDHVKTAAAMQAEMLHRAQAVCAEAQALSSGANGVLTSRTVLHLQKCSALSMTSVSFVVQELRERVHAAAATQAETLRRAQTICAEAEARADAAERRVSRAEEEADGARSEARRLDKELKVLLVFCVGVKNIRGARLVGMFLCQI